MKKFLLIFFLAMTFPMTIKADEVVIDGIRYHVLLKAKIANVIQNNPKYSGDIVIPASIEYEGVNCDVISIRENAFYECSSLTSVTIPSSVTSIGGSAFSNCSSLTSVNIPNSVTSIGESAFSKCSSLTSINIPNSITGIENYAFYECNKLQKVIVRDIAAWCNISFVGYYSNPLWYAHHLYSDENTEITNLIIPEGVTSIGESAFSQCSSLTSISIPNSVTSIGGSAFQYCYGLTSIFIPNSVTSIGHGAFAGCYLLEYVVLGNGITKIELQSFWNCRHLKNITIGEGVSTIGYDNFYNCEDLEIVTCKAIYPPTFYQGSGYNSNQPFSGSYIEYSKLIVPDESINAYKAASVWRDFGTIEGLSGSIQQTEKCATPTIHYTNGQLTFECETEGVTYQTTISDPDITSYSSNNINLTGKYLVKVYATKQGFENSDTATAEINLLEGSGSGIKGDVNNDKYVNMSDVTDIINIILGK